MKLSRLFHYGRALTLPFVMATFVAGCATATPVELVNARAAYTRAGSGPAAQLTPADLHKAKAALDDAEQSFAQNEESQKTIDLAYIAERMAQIAEARAQGAIAEKKTVAATQELGTKQSEMIKSSQGALTKSQEQLAQSERGKAALSTQVDAERTKAAASEQKASAAQVSAAESEQKAAAANDALAKLAAKEEERGTIITLSGSVLFRSNDSQLLPAALVRLDQVAEALVARGQRVSVEGYTDSRGSQASNMNLSQRRADSVRTYLVTRGFPMDKIEARGMGPDRPIAENSSAEGRANNRRVEIVIAKGSAGDHAK